MTIAAVPAIHSTESSNQEIDMLKSKSLMIAAVAAATVGTAALSSPAYAQDNPLLGAVVGAGIGAAIGHNVHGRDGAAVGGVIGAIAGASIAANSTYYDSGYYAAPATVYAPAPVYYGAAPATVYAPAPVYYPRPRFDYVHYYGARYVDHGRFNDHGHGDRHGNNGHRGR
jgi:hypothetical protein